MNKKKTLHSLNGYIHNVAHLLKFIKEDAVIENSETKSMLDLAILKEGEVMKLMEDLKNESIGACNEQ